MGLFSKKQYIYSDLKISEMLPVGSIVTLNKETDEYKSVITSSGQTEKFMIIDYKGIIKSKEQKNTMIEVDYWCVQYPEGLIDVVDPIAVNKKDIKSIIYKGYDSLERIEFLKKIEESEK